MDINTLREFTVFAQHMSVKQAADKLFISQPRLSQHLSALEAELGFDLFVKKGGRRQSLTLAGQDLYNYARRSLEEYDRLVGFYRNNRSTPVVLRIVKPYVPIMGVLYRAAQGYKRVRPDCYVRTILDNMMGVGPTDVLDRRLADAATLYVFPEALPALEERYSLIRLRSDEVYLNAPTRSKFGRMQSARVADLDGQTLTFIGDAMHPECYNRPILERLADRGVHVGTHIEFATSREEFRTRMSGNPSLAAKPWALESMECYCGDAVAIPLEDAGFTIDLYLMYRPGDLDPEQRGFLEYMKSSLEGEAGTA